MGRNNGLEESEQSNQYTGQCRGCGKHTILNGDGYCDDCIKKFKGPYDEEITQATVPKRRDNMKDEFPKEILMEKFRKFYNIFHRGSLIIGISTLIIWALYCLFGFAGSQASQNAAIQNYQYGTARSIQTVAFNPHWDVLIVAILILVLGTFLSYISAALYKWVENMQK